MPQRRLHDVSAILNRAAFHRKAIDGLKLSGFEGAKPLAAGLLRSGRTLLNDKKFDPKILLKLTISLLSPTQKSTPWAIRNRAAFHHKAMDILEPSRIYKKQGVNFPLPA
jgi:hypothetical protein